MAKATENTPVEMKNDPWKDMVEVMLPKRTRSEQATEYVSVNLRKYRIPKGVVTRVPRPVAEVLFNSMEAQSQMENNAKEGFKGDQMPVLML